MDLNAETSNANVIKNIVLGQLVEDKIITNDEANIYGQNWQIIIVKKSWFQKLTTKDKDTYYYKFVKMHFGDGYQKENKVSL